MNRFGMNMKANPVEDVVMKARLLMYKISGHQTANPALGSFMDRFQTHGWHCRAMFLRTAS